MKNNKGKIVIKLNILIIIIVVVLIISVIAIKNIKRNSEEIPKRENEYAIQNELENELNNEKIDDNGQVEEVENTNLEDEKEIQDEEEKIIKQPTNNNITNSSNQQEQTSTIEETIENSDSNNTQSSSEAESETTLELPKVDETKPVEEPKKEQYKLYDFGYESCYYCKVMDPIFDKYANSYSNIKFIKIDIYESSKNWNLFVGYGLNATPAFVMVDSSGKVVDKIIGAVSEDYFKSFVEKYK